VIVFLAMTLLSLTASCNNFPIRSAPGLYVNGWPAFTVSYPSHWQIKPADPRFVFYAGGKEEFPAVRISVIPNMNEQPLKNTTPNYLPEFSKMGKNIDVLYDRETRLTDGAPAWEAEVEWEKHSGPKINTLLFTAKRDDVWILVAVSDTRGRIGEDLKRIPYSMKIKPGKDELVEVPADIRMFLDRFSMDIEKQDMEKVIDHFSDKYLNNAIDKKMVVAYMENVLAMIPSHKISIRGFEEEQDKAYLAGFVSIGSMKLPLTGSPIIKENGKWKWYGNQLR
jgi:hypothetical protein